MILDKRLFFHFGLFFSLLFSSCNWSADETKVVSESIYKYGICVDAYDVISGQIESGQTLGSIFYLHHINHQKIDQIVKASKGVFQSVMTPDPLGYLIEKGPWFLSCAVYIRFRNSDSFIGAETIMLGMHLKYAISNAPWCVAPSAPTNPPRSRQKTTFKFCRATSCIT